MRESALEAYLANRARELGAICWKWQSSRRGVPDRIFIFKGQVVFIELKAPGGKPTAQQLHVHGLMIGQGVRVEVVDSKEAVDALLQELAA
jgi:phosphoketolase